MQVALSPNAVAVLRFEIKGYRSKVPENRLPAYRELAAAGIMEPVPGSEAEYRFTHEGMVHREAILEREFVGGRESAYRLTYWGYERRFELSEAPGLGNPS